MATIDHSVRIDAGGSGEIDRVMEIMEAAFGTTYGEAWTRSQLAGILPMAGVSLKLARDLRNDTVVGFSLSRTVADESELLLIAVQPRSHRKGIGRRLLDDFLQTARNDRVSRVHLEVRDGNPAINAYIKAGFAPAGRRRLYYRGADGSRHDAVTLAQQL